MINTSKRLRAAGVLILMCLAFSAPARERGTIDVSEIKPGMKGYGLTVLKGSEPVRFEVEVVDVVPRALPKQDMILVMCSGQDLEKTRVIAGMSGSPVYIEDRLAGAVAYAWAFAQDPLAGVTPIANMLGSMDKGAGLSRADRSAPLPAGSGESTGFTTVATPLIASGFSPQGLDVLGQELSTYNMIPLAGGGLYSTEMSPVEADSMQPGAAVGAALMTGDLSLTAIGTLTWREGDKILAFGHPFFGGGPISLPLVSARIHTVVSTQAVSFKMGSPTAVVGELVVDEQSAIAGVLGREARMIPLDLKVRREATGYESGFRLNLASEPALTPLLFKIALMEGARSAAPSMDPTTVRVSSKLRLSNYGEVNYEDVYPILRNNFSMGFLDPVLFFASNPFEEVALEKAEIELSVEDDLQVAVVESAWAASDDVSPGDTVEVGVVLRPYQSSERVEYRFLIEVPSEQGLSTLRLQVGGGAMVRPDEAVPRSVSDMIRYMDAVYPSDYLVVAYRAPGSGVDVKGRRLKSLPPSISSVLDPPNVSDNSRATTSVYLTKQTPYVILGAQRLDLKVDSPPRKRRR